MVQCRRNAEGLTARPLALVAEWLSEQHKTCTEVQCGHGRGRPGVLAVTLCNVHVSQEARVKGQESRVRNLTQTINPPVIHVEGPPFP